MTIDLHRLLSIGLVIDIRVTTKDKQEYIHKSRSVGSHGVIIEPNEDNTQLTLGATVILQVCSGLGEDGSDGDNETLPVNAEVTKISKNGIEFRFIL
jgi:hypothetical protein